jgi:hypothetical protein
MPIEREECPKCGGEGAVIGKETCDQYGTVHLDWIDCNRCGGEGSVEIEEEDDE